MEYSDIHGIYMPIYSYFIFKQLKFTLTFMHYTTFKAQACEQTVERNRRTHTKAPVLDLNGVNFTAMDSKH